MVCLLIDYVTVHHLADCVMMCLLTDCEIVRFCDRLCNVVSFDIVFNCASLGRLCNVMSFDRLCNGASFGRLYNVVSFDRLCDDVF